MYKIIVSSSLFSLLLLITCFYHRSLSLQHKYANVILWILKYISCILFRYKGILKSKRSYQSLYRPHLHVPNRPLMTLHYIYISQKGFKIVLIITINNIYVSKLKRLTDPKSYNFTAEVKSVMIYFHAIITCALFYAYSCIL